MSESASGGRLGLADGLGAAIGGILPVSERWRSCHLGAAIGGRLAIGGTCSGGRFRMTESCSGGGLGAAIGDGLGAASGLEFLSVSELLAVATGQFRSGGRLPMV